MKPAELTTTQFNAVLNAIDVALHIAERSPNTAYAYGFDLANIKALESVRKKIADMAPAPAGVADTATKQPEPNG
jgi:hypothetical protein